MMFPLYGQRPEDRRIVASWAGTGTCDTYYRTADGHVWFSSPTTRPNNSGTAVEITGRIIDGYIL
jgi:hypothetical protein